MFFAFSSIVDFWQHCELFSSILCFECVIDIDIQYDFNYKCSQLGYPSFWSQSYFCAHRCPNILENSVFVINICIMHQQITLFFCKDIILAHRMRQHTTIVSKVVHPPQIRNCTILRKNMDFWQKFTWGLLRFDSTGSKVDFRGLFPRLSRALWTPFFSLWSQLSLIGSIRGWNVVLF